MTTLKFYEDEIMALSEACELASSVCLDEEKKKYFDDLKYIICKEYNAQKEERLSRISIDNVSSDYEYDESDCEIIDPECWEPCDPCHDIDLDAYAFDEKEV